jgi:hypothetical protein
MFSFGSHDEITASKMLLEKANLVGYQVIKRRKQCPQLNGLLTDIPVM